MTVRLKTFHKEKISCLFIVIVEDIDFCSIEVAAHGRVVYDTSKNRNFYVTLKSAKWSLVEVESCFKYAMAIGEAECFTNVYQCMVWHGMAWYGMVWYGMVWYGMVWYGMVWYGMLYGMVWYMVWYGIWYGMVWYGMVWYGMVWYGMVWYGMVWYVCEKQTMDST